MPIHAPLDSRLRGNDSKGYANLSKYALVATVSFYCFVNGNCTQQQTLISDVGKTGLSKYTGQIFGSIETRDGVREIAITGP